MATSESKTGVKEHVRGILKHTGSLDREGLHADRAPCAGSGKEMKWDEMNILATYHPADKDYGHQKITDPPTPYSHPGEGDRSGDEADELDASQLADSLSKKAMKPKVIVREESCEDDDNEDAFLTEEQKAKKLAFKRHRKQHYNEFLAVKLHQQMHEEEEDDEEGNADKETDATQNSDMDASESGDMV